MSSYVVFAVICGPFIAASIVAVAVSAQLTWLKMTAVSTGALALSFIWLRRFRLLITADTVTYTSLLGGQRRITRADIIVADFVESTGATESPLTFVLRTRDGTELRINAKVFSLEAVQALVDLGPSSGPT